MKGVKVVIVVGRSVVYFVINFKCCVFDLVGVMFGNVVEVGFLFINVVVGCIVKVSNDVVFNVMFVIEMKVGDGSFERNEFEF